MGGGAHDSTGLDRPLSCLLKSFSPTLVSGQMSGWFGSAQNGGSGLPLSLISLSSSHGIPNAFQRAMLPGGILWSRSGGSRVGSGGNGNGRCTMGKGEAKWQGNPQQERYHT